MLTRGAGVTRNSVTRGISLVMGLLALNLLVQGLVVSTGWAQQDQAAPETPETPETPERLRLEKEVRSYRDIIASLRDSLSTEGFDGLSLNSDQRERLEDSIVEISDVVTRISEELAELEFEIKDNRLSLVNKDGEGIIINLPEDLDEQMSQGIQAITQIILAETDSIDFQHAKNWEWGRFRPDPPAPPKRVINGNIVKIWDDVEIGATEDVRGQVVVIFGNAEVDGRIDGNVVTVFGNLLLSDGSEITGTAVAAGGYLDQDPGAQVGDVVSIDLFRMGQGDNWQDFCLLDGWSFAITQGGFVLMVMLALVAVFVLPRHRMESVINTLQRSPMSSFGVGALSAIGGHFAVAIILVVLVLTVIGVPLALLVTLGLLLVVLAAIITCSATVGKLICQAITGECRSLWLAVVVGMVVLHSVSFVGAVLAVTDSFSPVASVFSLVGVLIKTAAYLLGLGAIVISRFGAKAPGA